MCLLLYILICEHVSFADVYTFFHKDIFAFLFPPCQYSSVCVSGSEFRMHFSSWFQSDIFHRQKQVLFYFQMSWFLSKLDLHISFYICTPKKEKDVCVVHFHVFFWNFPSCHSKLAFFKKTMLIQYFILDFWTFINVHFTKGQRRFEILLFFMFSLFSLSSFL